MNLTLQQIDQAVELEQIRNSNRVSERQKQAIFDSWTTQYENGESAHKFISQARVHFNISTEHATELFEEWSENNI